jgi:zinc protease
MAFLFIAVNVMGQEMPPLPVDKDVKIGKLDNGLTYYIRYNNWPENRAEFYIAQRVGSIQENDDQRGLAHFLEHMCFNGTEHFPGNGVIRYCESIGVQFGSDLNAATSFDYTVYNISNVPTARQSAQDSCLLILHDWADGLLLDPEEIDKERGVIHEEWRFRTSANMRMLEHCLPEVYPGSKYGQRMPIGKMEVVDNFKPQALRDYYEKWYRPDNQAIIVVGDVDVDRIEAKIKELFGAIKMPENPTPVVDEQVPDNYTPIYVIEKDKEQKTNGVEIMFKHDAFPDSLKNTMAFLLYNYVKGRAMSMLNARLSEYAQQSDCPFVSAGAGDGRYIFSKTKEAFDLNVFPKDGQLEAALTAGLKEARRAAEFGFTATEFQRSKSDFESALDKIYSNKDKRTNGQFVSEYVDHFLVKAPIPSLDDEYALMKQIIPAIPLEMINQYMKELIPASDTNMVVVSMLNEKEGNVYPTKASLEAAVAKARAEQLTAYVDNVKDEPLMTTLPKRGAILETKNSDKFDYQTLLLSNGVKVILKKTDYKKDQVMLNGSSEGGMSLYGDKDIVNLKMFNQVIDNSGLGNFSLTELQKALAGKIANASISLAERKQQVSGSSTPKDMETMFQLIYLYFTDIKKDQKSFDNIINSMELQLKNRALDPMQAFVDSVSSTLSGHNKWSKPLEAKDLKKVNYDRILQIAKERFSYADGYTFTIIGNFEENSIRPLIEQYLASLPVNGKMEKSHRISDIVKGNVKNSFKRKMETPQALSAMVWTNKDLEYNLQNMIRADMAGQVLMMIYLKKIREEASAAYTCSGQGSFQHDEFDNVVIVQAVCPMKPDQADVALKIMSEEVPNLTKSCDADMLTKVKEYMIKNIDDAAKTNNYWSNVITNYRKFDVDLHTDYKKVVEAQTPESICQFMREFLKPGNKVEVTMMPLE